MKVTLNNGIELYPIQVNGSTIYFQGASRDSFEFQFAKNSMTFEELTDLFGDESNFKSIVLEDSSGSFLHENYCIRTELKCFPLIIESATSTTPEVTEERFSVTMAQKTYSEVQFEILQAQINALMQG